LQIQGLAEKASLGMLAVRRVAQARLPLRANFLPNSVRWLSEKSDKPRPGAIQRAIDSATAASRSVVSTVSYPFTKEGVESAHKLASDTWTSGISAAKSLMPKPNTSSKPPPVEPSKATVDTKAPTSMVPVEPAKSTGWFRSAETKALAEPSKGSWWQGEQSTPPPSDSWFYRTVGWMFSKSAESLTGAAASSASSLVSGYLTKAAAFVLLVVAVGGFAYGLGSSLPKAIIGLIKDGAGSGKAAVSDWWQSKKESLHLGKKNNDVADADDAEGSAISMSSLKEKVASLMPRKAQDGKDEEDDYSWTRPTAHEEEDDAQGWRDIARDGTDELRNKAKQASGRAMDKFRELRDEWRR
jgi:hypothetical protein